MHRKFGNENKKQNKKNLRLKIYGRIKNVRLKLEPSVLIKRNVYCRKNDNDDDKDDYTLIRRQLQFYIKLLNNYGNFIS